MFESRLGQNFGMVLPGQCWLQMSWQCYSQAMRRDEAADFGTSSSSGPKHIGSSSMGLADYSPTGNVVKTVTAVCGALLLETKSRHESYRPVRWRTAARLI